MLIHVILLESNIISILFFPCLLNVVSFPMCESSSGHTFPFILNMLETLQLYTVLVPKIAKIKIKRNDFCCLQKIIIQIIDLKESVYKLAVLFVLFVNGKMCIIALMQIRLNRNQVSLPLRPVFSWYRK